MAASNQQSTRSEQDAVVIIARMIARHLYEKNIKSKAKKPRNTHKKYEKLTK